MDTGCAVKEFDPWRITLVANELGKTGFELETILQDEYSIYPEMATHKVWFVLPHLHCVGVCTEVDGSVDVCIKQSFC